MQESIGYHARAAVQKEVLRTRWRLVWCWRGQEVRWDELVQSDESGERRSNDSWNTL